MARRSWTGAALALTWCAAAARADDLTDLRRALWDTRGGTATPEGRAWGLALGRAAGEPNPLVFAAAPLPRTPGVTGTRVRAGALEGARLQFADATAAEAFGRRYWDAVREAGNGRFYPQQLEVRGRELILVEGTALNDPARAAPVLQAARAGAAGEPSLVGRAPGGRPEPLQRAAAPGLTPAVAPVAGQPSARSPAGGSPGGGPGGGGPGGGNPTGGNPTGGSPAGGGPTGGSPADGNPTGGDRAADGSPAAEQPAAADTDWKAWHRGITQGGVPLPRAGLQNSTLRRALGVATEPHGQVTTHEGKQFVKGKTSHFGGPRDTGVSASETGAISGERLRSLNSPLNPSPQQVLQNAGNYYYAAMRFDYGPQGKGFWAKARLLVLNPRTGRAVVVRNVDWGPNPKTRRVIDLSPTAMGYLGLSTDQEALVAFAAPEAPLGPLR